MKSPKEALASYKLGNRLDRHEERLRAIRQTKAEQAKRPFRYDVINELLSRFTRPTKYLEIGVRNPSDNFAKIRASEKSSVDPGVEYKANPADFKLTSDEFFEHVSDGRLLTPEHRWDVIFIDGLHLAEQVERDIKNSLQHLADDGFVVLHDCNPPTEWHARENHRYDLTPARVMWNGTTWKALYRQRLNPAVSVFCVDSDWGIGVILKGKFAPALAVDHNPYFEYSVFNATRQLSLNLMSYDDFRRALDLVPRV